MVLLISSEDLRKARLTAEETIAAVEDAYLQDGKGLAQDTPRREVRTKGKDLPHIAPGTESVGQGLAYLEGSNVLVISHAFHFSWHRYVTHLIDPKDGKTLAIIMQEREPFGEKPKEAFEGGFRTGAACAVGAKYLAKKHISTVGVIGTGRVGRASLFCLSKVRDFEKVIAYSGRRKDEGFAREMEKILGVNVIAAEGYEEVARKADVLITATFSIEPHVKGEWIKEGTHIAAMGADDPLKAEIDPTTFRRVNKILIDGEKCLTNGEISRSIKQGILKPKDIYGKIGEVVAGLKPGRENDSEITIFESDGTNIQSAGVSWMTYQKVKKMGLGIETSKITSYFINQ